ncbi:hypothetical protein ACFE04_017245 [Oxalis oulophora]
MDFKFKVIGGDIKSILGLYVAVEIKELNQPFKVKLTEWNNGSLLPRIEGLLAFLLKTNLVNKVNNFSELKKYVWEPGALFGALGEILAGWSDQKDGPLLLIVAWKITRSFTKLDGHIMLSCAFFPLAFLKIKVENIWGGVDTTVALEELLQDFVVQTALISYFKELGFQR